MKTALIILSLIAATTVSAQKLKFKVENHKDTTVHLVRYFGKGLYYADTAQLKNGMVEFDGSKQKPGILALFFPDQTMLEFVYNNEEVSIETTYPNVMGTSKVKKSEENKIFHEYVQFMATERKKAEALIERRNKVDKDSDQYKNLSESINETTKAVEAKQQDIVDNHKDMLVAKIIWMSMDIDVPEAPRDDKGNLIDSAWTYKYYHTHYFDHFDFNDDRLVRTPIFHSKLENYFGKNLMIQHCDTIIKYAFQLCDKLPEGSDTYQYTVSWITSNFEKSKIMNMDKVFVRMAERYYCPKNEAGEPKAFWVTESTLEKICDKADKNTRLVFGEIPPNIILRDTTDKNWKDFYSLDKEYTILYFWDPNCGHCKKITPKLGTLYSKKLKDRNIEIFAVGKAVGDEYQKWIDFIKKNNLEFINVGVTESMFNAAMDKTNNQEKLRELLQYTTLESINYQQTYDVFSTPRVFVLDKDKKIIAKSLTVSQLEDLLDKLQGKADSEKLFPADEEDKEESQMH